MGGNLRRGPEVTAIFVRRGFLPGMRGRSRDCGYLSLSWMRSPVVLETPRICPACRGSLEVRWGCEAVRLLLASPWPRASCSS